MRYVAKTIEGIMHMEFIIIYFYTIIATTIIGLKDSERQKTKISISKWGKIGLLIWTSQREIPIFFLIIRIFVQLSTILCFIILCFGQGAYYQEIQKIYGIIMVGIVIPVTIVERIWKK